MTPHDHAPPVSPSDGEPGSAAPARPQMNSGRSGSQNRQRMKSLQVALTPDELAEVKAMATASGLSPSSYGRAVLLGTPGPRAKRAPTVHAQLFGHGIAALNRAGNVVNQFAHRLNAGGAVMLGRECTAALTEILEAARTIREAVGRRDRDDHQGEQAQQRR
jgi:hypothetical protein